MSRWCDGAEGYREPAPQVRLSEGAESNVLAVPTRVIESRFDAAHGAHAVAGR